MSSSYLVLLGQNDVHRICSGQVILDLANAAKELVENSIDAGAFTDAIKIPCACFVLLVSTPASSCSLAFGFVIGARKVELRVVEYGSDSMEVLDDGSGIDSSNYEGLVSLHTDACRLAPAYGRCCLVEPLHPYTGAKALDLENQRL